LPTAQPAAVTHKRGAHSDAGRDDEDPPAGEELEVDAVGHVARLPAASGSPHGAGFQALGDSAVPNRR